MRSGEEQMRRKIQRFAAVLANDISADSEWLAEPFMWLIPAMLNGLRRHETCTKPLCQTGNRHCASGCWGAPSYPPTRGITPPLPRNLQKNSGVRSLVHKVYIMIIMATTKIRHMEIATFLKKIPRTTSSWKRVKGRCSEERISEFVCWSNPTNQIPSPFAVIRYNRRISI